MPPERIVVCIAPHPDDETLGCGMTLLRHIDEGTQVHWLIVTSMKEQEGFCREEIARREREIEAVATAYGFAEIHRAHLATCRLDTLPLGDAISAISTVIRKTGASRVYIPYRNDAHTDHKFVFDAATACCKSFRYPELRGVYAYETLSETEFGIRPDDPGFRPNLFIDGSRWLERKIEIMRLYENELAPFPFPRSEVCIRAQAALRGSQAGVNAAEAFMILREIR